MGACSPITLPVTVGLGGSMAATLNALAPVPMTDGGERFCARGSPIRLTFSVFDGPWPSSPYRFARPRFRIRGYGRHRALAITYLCWSVELEPRIICESLHSERWLGYPLLASSIVAPEPLFEHLCSSRGSSGGRVSMGVTQATPVG
jgi:hypothetical protein